MELSRGIVFVVAAVAAVSSGHQAPMAAPTGAPLGSAILVTAQDDFQSVLDRAQPGQTIVLEAGRTYEGPFTLPFKTGDEWITIRGNDPTFEKRVPAGRRVGPEHAPMMPRLISSTESVLVAAPGAHHYRLVGLEIAPAPGTFLFSLIDLGTDTPQPAAIPHDFMLERLFVRGDPLRGSRRGLALNSGSTTVVDSYFSDFKEPHNDSQAICGWNGPGPYSIVNNYLEAAGENLMFGGADPTIAELVPTDITIRRNYLFKPLTWRTPTADGTVPWTVKNLLELKNARKVVIEGNILENTWLAAQVGFAVLFTPRNQDGRAPWSVVEDVTFSNNIVRHVANGVHLLGRDNNQSSRQTRNVRIVNNIFEDVGGSWGSGRLFLLVDGTDSVMIDHNTAAATGAAVVAGETVPHTSFVFSNNIVSGIEYGIIGDGTGPGNPSLQRHFPGGVIRANAFVGRDGAPYPSGNYFPSSVDAIGFTRPTAGDYRLTTTSPLRGRGSDGRDIGADMDALNRAFGRVAQPRPGLLGSGALLLAIFWGSLLLIVYAYAGYPVMLWVLGHVKTRPVRKAAWYPKVTVLIVAHNEAARIGRRIRNILSTTYPAERREIVVVSDGSTDDTVRQARLTSPTVRVIEGVTRQGKAAVFNHIFPVLESDIVVLADARQRFAPDAIDALVADLADPEVGAVSGELVLGESDKDRQAAQGSGMYWKYEKAIRYWESLVDSSVGVTGAITAMRRSLFEQLPRDTVLDDLLIPLRIIRRGYRVLFEPKARAFDGFPAADKDEFARKARTLAGNFQLFARERWLFLPSSNRLWVQTLSHKCLRLTLPVLFVAAFGANVALASDPFYRFTLLLQLAFYALAAAGGLWPGLRRRVRWLVLPYTICFLSCATVVAFVRFLRRRQTATWDRTAITEPI